MKIDLKRNLKVIQEGDIIFIVPLKHYNIWDIGHKYSIKRAASILVIDSGVIVKNIMEKQDV